MQRPESLAREYLNRHQRAHPQAVTAMEVLEPAGLASMVRARLLETLETRNQSQDAFQITSDYAVAVARRAADPGEAPG